MKIVLIKDVKRTGREHEIMEVKDGYALNYLIPKKLAVPATSAAIKEAQLRRKQAEDRAKIDSALLAQNISALAEARIVIKTKANEKGHLYDAVGKPEIRNAVMEQMRIDLPERAIKLEKPIKELGAFDIPVATADTFGKFFITIEAE